MKKLILVVVTSAALLQVGSAAAIAVSESKTNVNQRQFGKQNIEVGRGARGDVMSNAQVQQALTQLAKALSEAGATASASVSLPPIPL